MTTTDLPATSSPMAHGDNEQPTSPELTGDAASAKTSVDEPSDVWNLYRAEEDGVWTTEKPKDLSFTIEPADSDSSGWYAMAVRWSKEEGERLQVHSITLRNEAVKKALGPVFADYPGITMTLEHVDFSFPFVPFVRRWDQFCRTRESEQDPAVRPYLDILHRTLTREDGRVRTSASTPGLMAPTVPLDIKAGFVDYNGEEYYMRYQNFSICPFQGTMAIDKLSLFSLENHADPEAMRSRLVTGGQNWEAYKGCHYRQFKGPGRVVIDAVGYHKHSGMSFRSGNDERIEEQTLNDEQRLLATPILKGYSLRKKSWRPFLIDYVEDRDLKRLILAVAKAQSLDLFDDVVRGKGQGVNILLSGPPGVGKTLTAESIVEVMQAPLYILSAGDLGTSAEKVESTLEEVLEIVPRWGAVLLIDEADVFLEARTTSDLARNELVSIFLRKLEYYEGLLFLTSNRAEIIDPAFDSRIHISLQYPDLDSVSRRQIWVHYLDQSTGFMGTHFDSLAEIKLNGRQIKNILKTAHLLARDQERELRYEDLETVISLRSLSRGLV
ncbi:ATP-binding protein [Aspergillus fijiensis CBS 313.89]|uniref:P-loop containing nucleoside triphosphate hydrolase protein n=1 Tax=Aspergillus fijiensis CBS 313.89 TaxID=1448319 RepID=A0A8G1RVC7_9EURO|nr:P-loop containing nucleoside triphosphate hydrolase protein [Aspergillus fijiensis CBS 313.89]RAK77451.1 P-loop containing nucleoside triphosphate hydrolase protein [Aspergillus fijiensis CBS 313.89]